MRGARSGGSTPGRSRPVVGIVVAALVLALSAGVAYAIFGSLTFVEQDRDGVGGVDGLDVAVGVAPSPDGAHVYVAGPGDDAIVTFARDPSNGALSFVELDRDGVAGVDGLDNAASVAPSPDGAHVYVAAIVDDAVATFARDAATGALSFVEQDKDGVGGVDGLDGAEDVAASPDGAHVYVVSSNDDAVAVFSRDAVTGALSFVEFEKDGVGGVDGIDDSRGVAVSPDGAHVYVTGIVDDAVAVFSRDALTGALSFVEFEKDGVGGVDGIDGATGVAPSPDGNHVYVIGRGDGAVATFARNATTGALSFIEQDKDGVGGVDGLDGADDLALSPDGAHVYVASNTDNAVAVFSRDAATGALSFVEFEKDGVGGVDGIDGAEGVAISPDGAHAYVTGFRDDAVATFAREALAPPPPDGGAPVAGPLTLDLEAKKQRLKKRLKFFATASADSTLVASGKTTKKKTKELAANEKTKIKVTLERAQRRRLANKLEEKGKAKTKIKAAATDQSGAEATDKVTVRLKD